MADQGRWFKLWTTAPADPSLLTLSPALRWAWVALGCYTKAHGTAGTLTLPLPNPVLAAEMGIETEALPDILKHLPHIRLDVGPDLRLDVGLDVRHEKQEMRYGTITVTWSNWQKYQEDSTVSSRMKLWRERKTLRDKKRREEKRTEETRILPPHKHIQPPDSFLEFWKQYPRKIGKGSALKTWMKLTPSPTLATVMLQKLIEAKTSAQWTRDGGEFIPHPTTWLNRRGWEDEYTTEVSEVRYGRAGA